MNLKKNIPDYIAYPLLAAMVGPVVTALPFVGIILLFLPFAGFFEVFEAIFPGNFSESGEHMDYWFLGVVPKTLMAWIFLPSFFFVMGLLLALFKNLAVRAGSNAPLVIAGVMMVATSWMIVYINNYVWMYLTQLNLRTPTETVFVCGNNTAFVLREKNERVEVWLDTFESWGLGSSLFGVVDDKKNTFTWSALGIENNDYAMKLMNENLRTLNSCKNINNKAILDIYTEVVPDDLFINSLSQYGEVTVLTPQPNEVVGTVFQVSGQIPFSWLRDEQFAVSILNDNREVRGQIVSFDKSHTSAYADYYANFNFEIDTSDMTSATRTCFGPAELVIGSLHNKSLFKSVPIECGN